MRNWKTFFNSLFRHIQQTLFFVKYQVVVWLENQFGFRFQNDEHFWSLQKIEFFQKRVNAYLSRRHFVVVTPQISSGEFH